MATRISGGFIWLREQSSSRGIDAGAGNLSGLEVNVIFTTDEGTLAALKTADSLARRLGTRIRLLAPQPVPLVLPLTHPQVSVEFLKRRLLNMARQCEDAIEVHSELLLCRDRTRCVLQVLSRNSVVVVGGKKRWWATREARLARALTAKGHHVIFAESR